MLTVEPLYLLVDIAVVGHLGRTALAIGGSVLAVATRLGMILNYGTTGRAARQHGAGDRAAAVAEGVQASWLALAAGLTILVAGQLAVGPLCRALAGPISGGAAAEPSSGYRSPYSGHLG